jgi:glycosyltransferase involved in cell wall biosynthesis
MLKVAVVTHYWKNSPGGGVKTYLTNLVDALEKVGVKTVVVFHEGSDPENFKVDGSRFLFPVRAFLRLRKIKPDVVHTQSTWYCLMAGYLYKLFSGLS